MRHDEPATMMHLIKPLLLLLGVIALLLIAEQASGDTLRIHDVAGSDGPVIVLSQVAELDGEYANKFADVIVGRFEDEASQAEIEASAILTAIRKEGAKLGLLDLKGFGKCTVHRTFTDMPQAEPVEETTPAANVESKTRGGEVTIHSATTVRALIERAVAERMGLGLDTLKISFSDRDGELLGQSAVAGRYEVEPVAEPSLGAVSFKVYPYSGTRRSGEVKTVSARVQQRVIAVVAGERIERGALINRRQVRLREVLIDDALQATLGDTSLVTGQVASMTIKPGDIITAESVKLPVAVRRRERVSVELTNGGVKITFNGVAQDEGAVGETIEVENPQTRERFAATVVGRGKVVAGINQSVNQNE